MRCLRTLGAALPLMFLAGSCQVLDRGNQVAAITCRQVPVAQQEPLTTAPWIPRFVSVESRGYYTVKSVQDNEAVAATEVTLSSLGLSPGDYVGLQAEGSYFFSVHGPETGSRLGAVFKSRTAKIVPGRSGDQVEFVTGPTYFGEIPTDIPQDFTVPADREVIVRVPAGADRIAFSPGDSHYSDNRPNGAFGVRIFKPNHEGAPVRGITDQPEEDAIVALGLARIDTRNVPTARSFSPNPFSSRQDTATAARWRGAYSTWRPADSRYGGRQGTHWGWDIFSPSGSKLIAPVWPSKMTFSESETYGSSVIFSFKRNGKIYHISYSHLSGRIGPERYIDGPEEVAIVGCTGNANGAGCGTRYANGTRNDHVHVGLFNSSGPRPEDRFACDPAGVLNWRPR
jgi:hypothetical protein